MKTQKQITGDTLIGMGYRPGKWFGDAIEYANAQGLRGQELKAYLDRSAPQILKPHAEPLPYHQNLRAETEAEVANVEMVQNTMAGLMTVPTVVKGAVMPDACPAGPMGTIPVGGVVATRNAIHPAMHSADICCSVMMSNFGHVDPKTVLDAAHHITHFGGGGREDTFPLPKELKERMRSNRYFRSPKAMKMAQTHLGTQGDGNHFLYVGRSEATGETIMVTHHGSRGVGAMVYTEGMKIAEGFRKMISPRTSKANAWIPFDEKEGEEYWEALQIVRDWTKLNHELLHETTSKRTGTHPGLRFWNEHNFVFKQDDLFYHAKGATPLTDAFVPDSHEGLRLIPLNMREPVLIVKGEATANNLGFAPHGAGRNVSRTRHKRNQGDRPVSEIFHEETEGLDVRFYSGHIDISELPSAYKDAGNVQAQMKEFGLGEVVDRVLPYGCIMAGDWQKDAPWRNKKKWRK